MRITPDDKSTASPILLLAGVFILLGGSAPLAAPFFLQEWWLLLVCTPITMVAWWIGRTLLASYLNSAFSTTELDFGEDTMEVRNHPFGKCFTVAYSDIRSSMVTDVMHPKACMEILITDQSHHTYQICAFRSLTAPIEEVYESINRRVDQALTEPRIDSIKP